MKVVIIGNGNVATVLAHLIKKNGHEILMIVGRNENKIKKLSAELQTNFSCNFQEINQDADIYIVSVSDNVLKEIVEKTKFPSGKIIVHTTGSASIKILENKAENFGVLYPLQSIRKETEATAELPFFIDGNNKSTKKILFQFAESLSPLVSEADDAQRIKLHIAAVFVSNFTNYLYSVAENFCEKENIDFHFLFPLIKETALRLEKNLPKNVMTGPALRKDNSTIESHQKILSQFPDLLETYNFLSKKIKDSTLF